MGLKLEGWGANSNFPAPHALGSSGLRLPFVEMYIFKFCGALGSCEVLDASLGDLSPFLVLTEAGVFRLAHNGGPVVSSWFISMGI